MASVSGPNDQVTFSGSYKEPGSLGGSPDARMDVGGFSVAVIRDPPEKLTFLQKLFYFEVKVKTAESPNKRVLVNKGSVVKRLFSIANTLK